MDRAGHWEQVYQTKKPTELSWYQPDPEVSLGMIQSLPRGNGRVIDVGGGESRLVDRLLQAGFPEITVLDISATALQQCRQRLALQSEKVRWLAADILTCDNLGIFDVWHDRAVFHFPIPQHREAAPLPASHQRAERLNPCRGRRDLVSERSGGQVRIVR
jgi:SAM-dependent methyltransferase